MDVMNKREKLIRLSGVLLDSLGDDVRVLLESSSVYRGVRCVTNYLMAPRLQQKAQIALGLHIQVDVQESGVWLFRHNPARFSFRDLRRARRTLPAS